jgi:hypothetical protein
MSTLDTSATLAALHRTNAIARVRKLTINEIVRESRSASSLEALRVIIEQLADQCNTHEQNNISKA